MYDSYYNLSGRPFQLNPDPRFFYGSPGHKRAISYLRYGLAQGEGFIVITGDIGTGKTMLVRTLFADLSKENVSAAQLVTTQLEADDTLRLVAASFGLAHEGLDKATLLKNLETYMVARAKEGKRVLLVVDEAHNLPARSLEELRMLSNFQLGGRVLFQSFLLGQAEFRNTLNAQGMEQLRQRVMAAYHLEPLDVEQTRAYVEHRLKAVDWCGQPQITDDAFQAVHAHTKGIPRRINTLCDRLLLYGALEELQRLDRGAVDTVYRELNQETVPETVDNPAAARGEAAVEAREAGSDYKASSTTRQHAENPTASQETGSTETGSTQAPDRGRHADPLKDQPTPNGQEGDRVVQLEERIVQLEQRVAGLEAAQKKDRQRLRKLILLSDDWEE